MKTKEYGTQAERSAYLDGFMAARLAEQEQREEFSWRTIAADIVDHVASAISCQEIDFDDDDELETYAQESADSHQAVIYTYRALHLYAEESWIRDLGEDFDDPTQEIEARITVKVYLAIENEYREQAQEQAAAARELSEATL
jgi:hypothetical protein